MATSVRLQPFIDYIVVKVDDDRHFHKVAICKGVNDKPRLMNVAAAPATFQVVYIYYILVAQP